MLYDYDIDIYDAYFIITPKELIINCVEVKLPDQMQAIFGAYFY